MLSSTSTQTGSSFLSTLPARGATLRSRMEVKIMAFLSTLPARGATNVPGEQLAAEIFLSTLPARGATTRASGHNEPYYYFYPRSPRGERHLRHGKMNKKRGLISIHAPREGSDSLQFLESPPEGISIHAPREGSDVRPLAGLALRRDFYPRSPRGERHDPIIP